MIKNKVRTLILITLLLLLCFFSTSCGVIGLLKQRIVNEIENKYVEYTTEISVEDIEDALVVASEIAKSSSIGVCVTTTSLLGSTKESGSAVILKKTKLYDNSYQYLAVTNRHVTGTKINGKLEVYLGNGTYVNATLLQCDYNKDLALISFNTGVLLGVATISSQNLSCGQFAIAVGSPYDLEAFYNSVTVGSISSTNRIRSENNEYGQKVNNIYIQHDASLNSGNSGGGLYDIYGNLIGINTWKVVGDNSDHIEGMCFAIPINEVLNSFSSYLK